MRLWERIDNSEEYRSIMAHGSCIWASSKNVFFEACGYSQVSFSVLRT